jgi:hypothetical protein
MPKVACRIFSALHFPGESKSNIPHMHYRNSVSWNITEHAHEQRNTNSSQYLSCCSLNPFEACQQLRCCHNDRRITFQRVARFRVFEGTQEQGAEYHKEQEHS